MSEQISKCPNCDSPRLPLIPNAMHPEKHFDFECGTWWDEWDFEGAMPKGQWSEACKIIKSLREDLPLRADDHTIATHTIRLHQVNDSWWLHYAGGPDRCIGCFVVEGDDGYLLHKDTCPVASLLPLLDKALKDD